MNKNQSFYDNKPEDFRTVNTLAQSSLQQAEPSGVVKPENLWVVSCSEL